MCDKKKWPKESNKHLNLMKCETTSSDYAKAQNHWQMLKSSMNVNKYSLQQCVCSNQVVARCSMKMIITSKKASAKSSLRSNVNLNAESCVTTNDLRNNTFMTSSQSNSNNVCDKVYVMRASPTWNTWTQLWTRSKPNSKKSSMVEDHKPLLQLMNNWWNFYPLHTKRYALEWNVLMTCR